MGQGLLTITGASVVAGTTYDVFVASSGGVAAGDHLAAELAAPAGEDAIYRVTLVVNATTIRVEDDLLEAHVTPFGLPAAGPGAFGTPGGAGTFKLSFLPESSRGWRALNERNNAILNDHVAGHAVGGSNPFTGQIINARAIADRIRETGGPTVLNMGAVSDGQYLARSGTDVVGVSNPADYAGKFEAPTITTGDIPNGLWGWWWDTSTSRMFLVRNRAGSLYATEFTPI
ncbi:MAG: hypothetical protein JSV86_04900 [Gemmatimonadota bacterium]|nr:MAG: hypothetical protein JSV86_04900 [Gemmatimonadota bacterium]